MKSKVVKNKQNFFMTDRWGSNPYLPKKDFFEILKTERNLLI